MTVERPASSRVDDVPNKLTERQWTAVFRRAVLASDVGGDSPIVRVVSAKNKTTQSLWCCMASRFNINSQLVTLAIRLADITNCE